MPDRPPTVSRIGWGWLIFGGLLFVRCILDLIVWRILAPAAPSLVSLLDPKDPGNALVRPLLDRLPTIKTVEATYAALVVLVASQFLRLKPWARPALQVLCGVVVAYVLAFGAFWMWLWPRLAEQHGKSPAVMRREWAGTSPVLAACLVAAVALVWMIRVRSSRRVREAFARPPVGV